MSVAVMKHFLNEIARESGVEERILTENFQRGTVAVLKPPPHGQPVAVGENLCVKVNANIGTSPDLYDEDFELHKLEAAFKAGADTVMDLSTGGNLRSVRRKIVSESSVPVGSVPIYEAIVEPIRNEAAESGWNRQKCSMRFVFTGKTG